MLNFYANRDALNRACHSSYRYFDNYCFLNNSFSSTGYVRSKSVGAALLPLAMHNKQLHTVTYCFSSTRSNTYEATGALAQENIVDTYNSLDNDTLCIAKVYAPGPILDDVCADINTDVFTNVSDTIQSLYNKCQDQVKSRLSLPDDVDTRTIVKVSRAKHMVVLISAFDDAAQASDLFLTVGLIPVLFPDWKDMFVQEEIDYFKGLVNRSQVKRISNVLVTNLFDDMCNSEYYQNSIKEIAFRNTINEIVSSKINRQREIINTANAEARRLLEAYQAVINKYNKAAEQLEKEQELAETTKEEMIMALNIEGIQNVNFVNRGTFSTIEIVYKAPATFYDMDEVTCALRNIDGVAKEFITDVFVDQKYTLMLLSKTEFSLAEDPQYQTPFSLAGSELNYYEAMYNPHIQYFSCLGDYKPEIIRAQGSHDLIIYNNLMLASTKSINFKDGTVIGRWKSTINNAVRDWANNYEYNQLVKCKCLVDSEGNKYSIKDVYIDRVTQPTTEEAQVLDVEEV